MRLARPPRTEQRWKLQLDELRGQMTDQVFDSAWADGRRFDVDHAIREALSREREPVAA